MNNENKEPVWKSILDMCIALCFIMTLFASIWTWVTNSSNFVIYVTLAIVTGGYSSTKYSNDEKHKMDKFSARLNANTDITKFEVQYLGGHPSTLVNSPCLGTLGISETKIGFISKHFETLTFHMNIDDINEVSEETQESLTLGRFLMVGILALALKKKERYLRITFKNDIGENSTIIFQTPQANWISQVLTKQRYDYIASNHSK